MSGICDTAQGNLERARQNIHAFNALSASYDAQINPLLVLEERYLHRMMPDIVGADVLDVGCGSGRWLNKLALLRPRSLTGLDPSDAMLKVANQKKIPSAKLVMCGCDKIPLPEKSVDFILASFVMSYVKDLACAAREIDRVARDGSVLFLSDMHPETQRKLGWKRAFHHESGEIRLEPFLHDVHEVIAAFQNLGWRVCAAIEPEFGAAEKPVFARAGRLNNFIEAERHPAIYILHLQKTGKAACDQQCAKQLILRGGRCVLGARKCVDATLRVSEGCVEQVVGNRFVMGDSAVQEIDLSGYMVMPGFINAHDHLEFSLFPRMVNSLYTNASDWALDIQERFKEVIARHRAISKRARLWWGGIRNLLCGVTTVCHHNPQETALLHEDFPVRVLRDFGWAHSLAFGGDLRAHREATAPGNPFIVHACEGIDQASLAELWELDRLGILDKDAVLVHALALDDRGAALLQQRGVSVITCPSSNSYLFDRTPDIHRLMHAGNVALGSDSPLTSIGDLLDEIHFAVDFCHVSPEIAYRMVTDAPAAILRLRNGEGSIKVSGRADFIAVRDTGCEPAERLHALSAADVEMVMIGGCVQLASRTILERIPQSMSEGLEPLWVDGVVRWLRAPVRDLLRQAEEVLGTGAVRLGGKAVRLPRPEEIGNAV